MLAGDKEVTAESQGGSRTRLRKVSRARAPDSPCRASAGAEPHVGERPDRASNIVASANTWKCWLDRSEAKDSVGSAGTNCPADEEYWKDTRMPMRYGERVLAPRGAMARAAKSQGRM
jgi:hypothetical protein